MTGTSYRSRCPAGCWLCAWLRTAYQKVSAESIIGGYEIVVVLLGKTDKAFVGRQILILISAQPERVAMHHALEFSHMLRHLFPGILRHGCMESLFAAFHLVAGDILVVHEVGGDGDIEYGFIGILHADHTVATGLRSLAALGFEPPFCP